MYICFISLRAFSSLLISASNVDGVTACTRKADSPKGVDLTKKNIEKKLKIRRETRKGEEEMDSEISDKDAGRVSEEKEKSIKRKRRGGRVSLSK